MRILTLVVICAVLGLVFTPSSDAKHPHRYLVAKRLKDGLTKPYAFPLRRYAFAMEAAGHRYNVNPYFIAAIAGVESTFGKAACGGNAWGIGSCSVTFPTFKEGAFYTARLLRTGYLNRGLRDVYAVGRVYCPPCGNRWGEKVAYFMRYFFRSPPAVTYPPRP